MPAAISGLSGGQAESGLALELSNKQSGSFVSISDSIYSVYPFSFYALSCKGNAAPFPAVGIVFRIAFVCFRGARESLMTDLVAPLGREGAQPWFDDWRLVVGRLGELNSAMMAGVASASLLISAG